MAVFTEKGDFKAADFWKIKHNKTRVQVDLQTPAPLPTPSLGGLRTGGPGGGLGSSGRGEREGLRRMKASVAQLDRADKGRQLREAGGDRACFVPPDICYMSPAASWRRWLTACGNNASPSPTHIFSLLRSFLTQAVPWRAWLPSLGGGVTEMKPLAQSPAGDAFDERGQECRVRRGEGQATMKKKHASLTG